jgi:hypothetical protein
MIQALPVQGAGSSNQPVDFIALVEQQFRQIRTILAANAGDKGTLHARQRMLSKVSA